MKGKELSAAALKTYKGKVIHYIEVFYLDYAVNEETGMITDYLEKYYTKSQIDRNINALKEAIKKAKLK